MSFDNTRKDIFVLTNSTDPTVACIQSRGSASVVSNIPIVFGDTLKFRFFLMEQESSSGQLINRQLIHSPLETLRVNIQNVGDTQRYGTFSTTMTHNGGQLEEIRGSVTQSVEVYIGDTVENLSGEYVAFTFLTAETSPYFESGVRQARQNVVYWFRNSPSSLPPNLEGYEHVAVDITASDDDSPAKKLQAAITAHSLATATHVSATDGVQGEHVRVSYANGGDPQTDVLVSSSKLGVSVAQRGQDYLYGYCAQYPATDSQITTDMSTADTLTAKMVIQLIADDPPYEEKTLAIQDCTFYRDFSDFT